MKDCTGGLPGRAVPSVARSDRSTPATEAVVDAELTTWICWSMSDVTGVTVVGGTAARLALFLAEIHVVVFALHGPVARQRELEAAADHPARACLVAGRSRIRGRTAPPLKSANWYRHPRRRSRPWRKATGDPRHSRDGQQRWRATPTFVLERPDLPPLHPKSKMWSPLRSAPTSPGLNSQDPVAARARQLKPIWPPAINPDRSLSPFFRTRSD